MASNSLEWRIRTVKVQTATFRSINLMDYGYYYFKKKKNDKMKKDVSSFFLKRIFCTHIIRYYNRTPFGLETEKKHLRLKAFDFRNVFTPIGEYSVAFSFTFFS